MIAAKFYPFVYQSVVCNYSETQFRSVMKPKIGSRFSDTPYLSNEMMKK